MSKDNFKWDDKKVYQFTQDYISRMAKDFWEELYTFKGNQPKEQIYFSDADIYDKLKSMPKFAPLYTQEDLEDAFLAAREIDFSGRHTAPYYKYPTFQDYINQQKPTNTTNTVANYPETKTK